MNRLAALAICVLASAGAAHAQLTIPQPGPGDPRIREVTYDPNAVIAIRGELGYEITIEFDPDERIENVSIGDSLSWQVTPNRKATMLFLKPMSKVAPTSMTVATNQRLYSFLLRATDTGGPDHPDAMFRLRFLYPAPPVAEAEAVPPPAPPPPPMQPEQLNFAFTWKGAKNLAPARIFDDGKATYFQFAPGKDTPAVFVFGADGREEMANTRVANGYTVADFTAERFVLRYGKAKLDVKNDGWRPPVAPALPLPPQSGG